MSRWESALHGIPCRGSSRHKTREWRCAPVGCLRFIVSLDAFGIQFYIKSSIFIYYIACLNLKFSSYSPAQFQYMFSIWISQLIWVMWLPPFRLLSSSLPFAFGFSIFFFVTTLSFHSTLSYSFLSRELFFNIYFIFFSLFPFSFHSSFSVSFSSSQTSNSVHHNFTFSCIISSYNTIA